MEIKNNFFKGKQNRDFDDRLVPNGEYRYLINGRSARSEGADVGAIENVLGNLARSSFRDPSARVIGSIRDQQRDRIYYFIVGQREDAIVEFNERTQGTREIIRSTSKAGILKFSVDHLITGVNLIGEDEDRLLYWTDGINPPRKIHIERMITRHRGRLDGVIWTDPETNVEVVPNTPGAIRTVNPFTEAEISVVKAPPLRPPSISASEVAVQEDDTPDTAVEAISEENLKEKFIRFATRYKYIDGEYSAFSPFSKIPFNAGRFEYDRKTGLITSMENLIREVSVTFDTGPRDVTEIDLLYIDTSNNIVFVVESFNKEDEGWPNDEVLSDPGEFADDDYTLNPVKFSSNKLYRPLPEDELFRVFDEVPLIARTQDIVENRIVYGDYTSRYDIEDLRKTFETQYHDAEGNIVPKDQEGAMEVQVLTNTTRHPIVVDFDVNLAAIERDTSEEEGDADDIGDTGIQNLKADRDYELALVYGDNVGRQTPPLTSRDNSFHIPLSRSNKVNRLEATIKSKAPEWATWYRWYIKNAKTTHYNIIPVEKTVDPQDPDSFIWFRLSEADQDKVRVGDYLLLKVSKNEFINDQRVEVRVEEISIKERNFLEAEPPRIDDEDDTSPVYTEQAPGLWMKIKHTQQTQELLEDDGYDNSWDSSSQARPNNGRGLGNYEPIQNVGTLKPSQGNYNAHTDLLDYIDHVHWYPSATGTEDDPDGSTMMFGGTYTPSATGVDPDGNAWLGGGNLPNATGSTNAWGSGPMRIVIEITPGNKFKYEYFINHKGMVDKVGSPAYESNGEHMIRSVIDTEQDITLDAITLVNGATITFSENPDDAGNPFAYNPGDRFTVVYRRAHNYMWTWQQAPNDGGAWGNPNFGSEKQPTNSRKANVIFPINEEYLLDDGIYGNSRIQIGIVDGKKSSSADNYHKACGLEWDKNRFTTSPQFYETLEEWMFEDGLWHPGGAEGDSFAGTNKSGNRIGMSQFGFWRGFIGFPGARDDFKAVWAKVNAQNTANLIVKGLIFGLPGLVIAVVQNLIRKFVTEFVVKLIKQIFPPRSNKQERIFCDFEEITIEGVTFPKLLAAPLYGIFQGGRRNKKSNRDAPHYRTEVNISYSEGNVGRQHAGSRVDVMFETIPGDSAVDEQVFYETYGDTFKCHNGIHFGLGDSSQNIIYIDKEGNEVQYAGDPNTDDRFDALTETAKVTDLPNVPIDYFNCIAFDNGIESMTIRDEYGRPEITKGVKAATVLDEYNQVRNFSGLIFSGPFVDTTGINRLNEFSAYDVGNRTNVKDLDDSYGPIRHLYSENTNLLVWQDSKVSMVQVDKNALYNADGSGNVAATNRFLGQTVPFPGEYGISNNPESFQVYGHTKFWADKNRGVVLQLEGKQISEISEMGMRDFFRDNLAKYDLIIGSYDDYHDQYLLTMQDRFIDPSVIQRNIPILISRQGFLSRNEACRFPENKLQYVQVYEFYEDTTPLRFTVGDTIYLDEDRTSVFNGDNEWFVSWEKEEVEVTNTTSINDDGSALFTATGANAFLNSLEAGHVVTLESNGTGISYNATVTETEEVNDITYYRIQLDGTPDPADVTNGQTWDIEIDFKFVVQIDNFGVVRRKLDCVNVPPLNHDAFRISLYDYGSPEEACANGLVGQIVYHNGTQATPNRFDYVYDSPYGSDEYVDEYQLWLDSWFYYGTDRVVHQNKVWEAAGTALQDEDGNVIATMRLPEGVIPGDTEGGADAYWVETDLAPQYTQGRTQRRGWFKMFDGVDFEDYVIHILRGQIVAKIPCAAIMAGRRSILIGSHFVQGATQTDELFAQQICRSIPANEAWHDGDNELPRVGNTLYQDNHTAATYGEGSYPIQGGYYVEVNEDGNIVEVLPCYTVVCLTNLSDFLEGEKAQVGGSLVFENDRFSDTGKYKFLGIVDEEIFMNTERHLITGVTIKWAAQGASRYPSAGNTFYELSLPDGLLVDGEFTLTNPGFEIDSVGETDLRYSILEVCYHRTLVPQTVRPIYYNDGGEQFAMANSEWRNATSSTDAYVEFANDADALAAWNFLSGDTETTVTDLISVAREDFVFSYGFHTDLMWNNGSAIALTSPGGVPTLTFTGSGFSGTTFAFPDPPPPGSGDIVNISSGGVPTCTDQGVTYQYPSGDSASIVSRIFDTTGSQCTGTVGVSDELYYDITNVGRPQFFTDDTLMTPLDGTDGVTNTSFLDSRVIDGVTRYGLWWAFGTVDNAAAEFAYLIDKNGFVLDDRSRLFSHEITLRYASTPLLSCTTENDAVYLADHPDFYSSDPLSDVTEGIRTLDDEGIPPTGYYSWFYDGETPSDPLDDDRYTRYWDEDTRTFSAADPIVCPFQLPSVTIRFSTDPEQAFCGGGSILTVYTDSTDLPLGDNSDVQLWQNQYGQGYSSLLTAGYIRIDATGTDLYWDGVSTLTSHNHTCIQYCTDVNADNTNDPGICLYPTYCDDSRYEEYLTDSNGKVWTDSTIPDEFLPNKSICSVLLPAYEPREATISVVDNVTVGCTFSGDVYEINSPDVTITRTQQPQAYVRGDATLRSLYLTADGTAFAEDTAINGDSFGPDRAGGTGDINILDHTMWREDTGDPFTYTEEGTGGALVINGDTNLLTLTYDGNIVLNQPQDVVLRINDQITGGSGYTVVVAGGNKIGDTTRDRILPDQNFSLDYTINIPNTTTHQWVTAPTGTITNQNGSTATQSGGGCTLPAVCYDVVGQMDECQTETLFIDITITGEIESITPCEETGPSIGTLNGGGTEDAGQSFTIVANMVSAGNDPQCTDYTITSYNWTTPTLATVVSGCGTSDSTCSVSYDDGLSGQVTLNVTNSNGDTSTTAIASVTWNDAPDPIIGCMDSDADNYDDEADTAGTCYYLGAMVADGDGSTVVCDGFNDGTITQRRQQYTQVKNPTYADGLQIYQKVSGTGKDSVYAVGGSGWFTDDGDAVWEQTNGTISNYDADGCPEPIRLDTGASHFPPEDNPIAVQDGEEFSIRVIFHVIPSTEPVSVMIDYGDGVGDVGQFYPNGTGTAGAEYIDTHIYTEGLQFGDQPVNRTVTATIYQGNEVTEIGELTHRIRVRLDGVPSEGIS